MTGFLLGVVALVASVAQGWAAVELISGPWRSADGLLGFGAGVALAFAAVPIIARMRFVNTFGHELSHSLVAIATGGRVTEFMATETAGGHICHASPFRLPVSLAPYSLPLSALAVALVAIVSGGAEPGIPVGTVLGATFGYHIVRAGSDVQLNLATGPRGTDFESHGTFVSLLWIMAANGLFGCLLASFAAGGTAGVETLWLHTGDVLRGWLHAVSVLVQTHS